MRSCRTFNPCACGLISKVECGGNDIPSLVFGADVFHMPLLVANLVLWDLPDWHKAVSGGMVVG